MTHDFLGEAIAGVLIQDFKRLALCQAQVSQVKEPVRGEGTPMQLSSFPMWYTVLLFAVGFRITPGKLLFCRLF